MEQSISALDIKTSFILAYRLEFFLLHPAFDIIFYFTEIELKNSVPDHGYKDHIRKLISTPNTFGIGDILIQLTAEMIEGIWTNNRLISKQFYDIKTLTGIIPFAIIVKRYVKTKDFGKR